MRLILVSTVCVLAVACEGIVTSDGGTGGGAVGQGGGTVTPTGGGSTAVGGGDAAGGGSAAVGGGDATGGGSTAVGGGSSATGGGSVVTGPCHPLTVDAAVVVDGYKSDRFTWYDRACQPRTAAMVRNDAADPGGTRGGYLRELTYQVNGATRHVVGQPGTTWKGWGYVVSHYAATAGTSAGVTGTWQTVLSGRHHAIHQYKLRFSPGGPVDVTIRWMFATGRSNPIFAITHDSTPAGANAVSADARSPYGNLTFDGDTSGNGAVTGLGWGDSKLFLTTGSGPVTTSTGWDYTANNAVPLVLMWSTPADAEMGAVQTQTFAAKPAGGDYGGGILSACQGHSSANPGSCMRPSGQTMPQDWLWPYQLSQYELPFVNSSKRLAWGATYGAVGQQSYKSLTTNQVGYPFQSYSVYLVLDPHSAAPTIAQATEVSVAANSLFTASVGTVVTTGPGGVGRVDNVPYSPLGYDPIFGVWAVAAAGNAATVTLNSKNGSLEHPIFQLRGYTGTAPPSHVRVGGVDLVADVDYFATVDSTATTLWLTLNRTVQGTIELQVVP